MLLWTKRLDDQQDGELVTWGSSVDGGDSSRVQEPLRIHGIRRKKNNVDKLDEEFFHDILLMDKILHHLGWLKPYK